MKYIEMDGEKVSAILPLGVFGKFFQNSAAEIFFQKTIKMQNNSEPPRFDKFQHILPSALF